jgi:FixJ family two-component response regulator
MLLTDVVLSGMDGVQLAALVTRARPDVHVLFMSGYARNVGSIVGDLDPAIHFLEKPFTALTLLTRTRQVLGVLPEPSLVSTAD